jgi:hypothetical protein
MTARAARRSQVDSREREESARLSALFERRLTGYAERLDSSLRKLRRAEYHAEDLVDDWSNFVGNSLRDVTAVATIVARTTRDRRARRATGRSAPITTPRRQGRPG